MNKVTFMPEPDMPDLMLKQILSWPSKVQVDEVAAILFEGVYRILRLNMVSGTWANTCREPLTLQSPAY